MQETPVPSLGREDPLEKEMTTDFSILTWEMPRTEEPGGLQSLGLQESDPTLRLNNNNVKTECREEQILKANK